MEKGKITSTSRLFKNLRARKRPVRDTNPGAGYVLQGGDEHSSAAYIKATGDPEHPWMTLSIEVDDNW